jgi:hypothetical protein
VWLGLSALRTLFLMLADTSSLNHPQPSVNFASGQTVNQSTGAIDKVRMFRFSREAKHGDPCVIGRPEQDGITKIQIQGYEASPFPAANLNQVSVGCAIQALITHGGDVMTRFFKEPNNTPSKVLVKLQPHLTASVGLSR